jgi:hypothetical protein
MELIGTNKNAKKRIDYICEKCAFNTCNKTDYARHIKTIKHLGNEMELIKTQKTQKDDSACICGKTYKTAAGLWKHKKICIEQKDSDKDQMLSYLLIKITKNSKTSFL